MFPVLTRIARAMRTITPAHIRQRILRKIRNAQLTVMMIIVSITNLVQAVPLKEFSETQKSIVSELVTLNVHDSSREEKAAELTAAFIAASKQKLAQATTTHEINAQILILEQLGIALKDEQLLDEIKTIRKTTLQQDSVVIPLSKLIYALPDTALFCFAKFIDTSGFHVGPPKGFYASRNWLSGRESQFQVILEKHGYSTEQAMQLINTLSTLGIIIVNQSHLQDKNLRSVLRHEAIHKVISSLPVQTQQYLNTVAARILDKMENDINFGREKVHDGPRNWYFIQALMNKQEFYTYLDGGHYVDNVLIELQKDHRAYTMFKGIQLEAEKMLSDAGIK